MKTVTYNDIKSWGPCYDPIKHIPESWSGTAIDILNMNDVSTSSRLWCVLRPELLSDKLLRLFAVGCCREVLKFITNPDPRSVEAVNVTERYAHGEATKEELRIAHEGALYVAYFSCSYFASAASYASASYDGFYSNYNFYSAAAGTRTALITKLIEMINEEENDK